MKEKGIETAIRAVEEVNQKLGYTVFSLDIYGPVAEESKEWFQTLQDNMQEYICYRGCVSSNQSVDVLKEYFALLFPTHFYTEGIPGTIIDAYASGVPVIAAKWESYADVVDEDITGVSYEFEKEEQLADLAFYYAQSPEKLLCMRENCIRKAQEYTPPMALRILVEQIKGNL
jgi:glycosyltransferase involved in cell wall biosynthesis